MVFRDTVGQNRDRRMVSEAQYLNGCLPTLRLILHQVLQLEIVDDPTFTKHYLNFWRKILEKSVINRDMKESVREPSKVNPTLFLYS